MYRNRIIGTIIHLSHPSRCILTCSYDFHIAFSFISFRGGYGLISVNSEFQTWDFVWTHDSLREVDWLLTLGTIPEWYVLIEGHSCVTRPLAVGPMPRFSGAGTGDTQCTEFCLHQRSSLKICVTARPFYLCCYKSKALHVFR